MTGSMFSDLIKINSETPDKTKPKKLVEARLEEKPVEARPQKLVEAKPKKPKAKKNKERERGGERKVRKER